MEAKILLVHEEEFDAFSNTLIPREAMWGHMPVRRCFCFVIVYSYIIIFILEERHSELMPSVHVTSFMFMDNC
jgi:hypothetical protein